MIEIIVSDEECAAIEAAYEHGKGRWVDAHWMHSPIPIGQRMEFVRENGKIVVCDGSRPCQTCMDAKQDAVRAEALAEKAMTAFRNGDVVIAYGHASAAFAIEYYWGEEDSWWALKDRLERVIRNQLK